MSYQETCAQLAEKCRELFEQVHGAVPEVIDEILEHPELFKSELPEGTAMRSDCVADLVIANLVEAHSCIARSGSVCDLISLSQYLLEVVKSERDFPMYSNVPTDWIRKGDLDGNL